MNGREPLHHKRNRNVTYLSAPTRRNPLVTRRADHRLVAAANGSSSPARRSLKKSSDGLEKMREAEAERNATRKRSAKNCVCETANARERER